MPDEVVKIEWGIIPNGNERAGGFLPVYYVDGRQRGHTFGARGYDADEALLRAEAMAREEADRYIGDWKVTVKHRKNTPFGGTMGSADRQTMQEFVRRHVLRMESKRDRSYVPTDEWGRGASHWICTIYAPGGKRLTTRYHMGSAHKGEPEVADVLSSMASDASSAENAGSWIEFARDMGMETDIEDPRTGRMVPNKKAKQTYEACMREGVQLLNTFGGTIYHELLYETEPA